MNERRSPLLQILAGVGSALAVLATLVAPLWMIEIGLVALSAWFLSWVVRTQLWRLSSPRRIPRLMVFAPLGIGIAVNLHLVNATARPALALNLLIFLAALVVGLFRVFRAPVPPLEPAGPISEQR